MTDGVAPRLIRPAIVEALGELEDYVRENEGSVAEIGHAEAIRRLIEENRELNASVKLRWDADMRAIKKWQGEYPDRELVWPDHADLVIWLMSQLWDSVHAAECHLCPGDMCSLDDDSPAIPHQAFVGMFRR